MEQIKPEHGNLLKPWNTRQKSKRVSGCSTHRQKELENALMTLPDDSRRQVNTCRNTGPKDLRPSNTLLRQPVKQEIRRDLVQITLYWFGPITGGLHVF